MAKMSPDTNLQILGNFHLTFIGIIRGPFYWRCYEISKSELISLANRGVYAKLVSLVLRDVEVTRSRVWFAFAGFSK